MEPEFLLNCGGNLLSIGLALGIYVLYSRCVHSRCAIHSTWLDCESDEIKQLKFSKQKTVLKQALEEIRVETERGSINGSNL